MFDCPKCLANYLERRLIPDLKESGMEATAEDFENCLQFLKRFDHEQHRE